jgi:hypothetical protein
MLFPNQLARIDGCGADELHVARRMLDPDFKAHIPVYLKRLYCLAMEGCTALLSGQTH